MVNLRARRPLRRPLRTPAVLAVVVLLATLVGAAAEVGRPTPAEAYAGAPWFRPGVPYDQNFPDPTVVRDGSTYWAYGTSTGGSLVPAMSSTDLRTWTPRPAYSPNPYNGDPYFNDSYPRPPAWSIAGRSRAQAQWAPAVVKLQGQWVAYTSWEVSPGRRCISVARASSPMGPFLDDTSGPLVCDIDPGGSIDPAPFVDTDGTPYLLWKATGVPGSAPTKIKSRRLSADGMTFAPGSTPVAILQTELPWEGNSIENPSMVRYQGRYWLIYSGNEWESADYRTGQAACAGPLGPCSRTSPNPLVGNSATEWSPGGGTLFVDASGRLRHAYQVWNAPYTSYPTDPNCDRAGLCASRGQRTLRIDGVAVSAGQLTVDPTGYLDRVEAVDGGVRVSGWALDPSTTAPIDVHVYVDGVGHPRRADAPRPDVGSANPGLGDAHGFDTVVPAGSGTHRVCVYGIGVQTPGNPTIGCRTVTVTGSDPIGYVDTARAGIGSISVSGWALDPDTSQPIDVKLWVDGAITTVRADASRPDVGNAFPGKGSNHGFSATVPAAGGPHTVCTIGVNAGPGADALVDCRRVDVPGGNPIGWVDGVEVLDDAVALSGWTIDPDVAAPIDVHVYVDGRGVATRASGDRPDVGAVFPPYGPAHGFRAVVPAAPGVRTACAYAINVASGTGNTLLGCRTVDVPDRHTPVGVLDAVEPVAGGVRVQGWAIDRDTTQPVDVHVYVDGSGVPLRADVTRTDVGDAFPGYGSRHGFEARLAAGPGPHRVCAYAINVGPGGNALLGCRDVRVG